MKARIKATGEIAEFSTGKNSQGETILLKVGTASIFSLDEVEPIHDVDWNQVRIMAAIAAMQGILSNSTIVSSASFEDIAETAVNMADALILRLEQNDKV